MSKSETHHFYLIAGMVMFSVGKDEDGQISSVPTNAVVRHTDGTKFPAAKLAKAQQNLHKTLIMKMPEEAKPLITVRDIIITNVSYLGEMTEEEFQAPADVPDAVQPPAPEVI
ncbi:hypothetical protein [Aquabacterium sp.]|uniref:hypothetical protein n=1 Tax=Aquabacterium sp. TaxID=1872578 RepID=UPI0025C0D4CE|nr:hypothetical protein [Aquabacterium sp.]